MDDFEPINNDFEHQKDYSFDNFSSNQNFETQGNFSDNFKPQQGFEPMEEHFDNFSEQNFHNNFTPQMDSNFEPINSEQKFDGFDKEENKQNSTKEEPEETEEQEDGGSKITKIAIIILAVIFCGFFVIMFTNVGRKGKADYTEMVVERQAPTNRVKDLRIIPNKSVFKAGEQFKFDISRDVFFKGDLTDVVLSFKIPVDIPYRQKIENLTIVPTPTKIEKEDDGTYAYISLHNPKGTIQVHIAGLARVGTYTAENAVKFGKNIDGQLSSEDKEIYTSSERNIESNDSFIKTIASKSIPTATNELDTVKNIFDYVVATIRYNENDVGKDKGAVWALRSKSGVCMEFADTMVALCRAKGIPARVVYGFDVPFVDTERLSNNGHAWVEVYFPEYGWVTFDPTNKIPNSIIKEANALRVMPYELLSYAFQNRIYLTVDTNEIHMHYKGNGEVESKNLHIKLLKMRK